jgi:hypothetical protein
MSDYEIGYGKPPKAFQFQPGTSGHPPGRPKRKPSDLARSIIAALETPIEYNQDGSIKKATGIALQLKTLIKRALRGDVDAATTLLKIRIQAEAQGDGGDRQIVVTDWLPDPEQTAEEKTRELAGVIAEPLLEPRR